MNEKPYHHENLREKLIEAGICLINEQGYEQLSLRKIAAACGVSHTAPYRHFSDKAGLLIAMQQYVEQRFAQILQESIARHQSAPNPMIEFGKAYVLFFADHPQYYAFFTHQDNIRIDLSESKVSAESNYTPFQLFKAEADKHLAQHNIPKDQYIAAITSMWATVHGLAGLATMSGVHYDEDWGRLTEKILKGAETHEEKISPA